jgi:hypothetical protein
MKAKQEATYLRVVTRTKFRVVVQYFFEAMRLIRYNRGMLRMRDAVSVGGLRMQLGGRARQGRRRVYAERG